MTPAKPRDTGSQTLNRGLRLLELLVRSAHPLRPSEMATELDVDRTAVYRMLRELQALGYIERGEESGRYLVASGLIALSAQVMKKVDIRRAARPMMQVLGKATGETVSLHIRHGTTRICVEVVPSVHTLARVVPIGETLPLYAGPTGKAMLAFVEPEEVDTILNDLAHQVVDLNEVRASLEYIRTHGYIVSVGDRTPGVSGLSAPVFDHRGIAGALTLSGPASRWSYEAMEETAPLLVEQCELLSRSIGHSPIKSPSNPPREQGRGLV